MPTRLYFNASPYSFQGPKVVPYTTNNNVYEHQNNQQYHQYPYNYSGNNRQVTPAVLAYDSNQYNQYRTNQQIQYYTAYQYHQYHLALMQYYIQNYNRNQYQHQQPQQPQQSRSPIQFQITAYSPQPHQQQQLVPVLKPNPPEVYHKIPEFKTIRKRLPLNGTWSKNSKPKLALDKTVRSKSVSVEKQQEEINSKNLKEIATKIVELTEMKKKMENFDENSTKPRKNNEKTTLTKIDKQLKIEFLKELNKNNHYNVYMNSFPFNSANISSTDESGLGDIDIKSKSSSSRFTNSEHETQSETNSKKIDELNVQTEVKSVSLVDSGAEIKISDPQPMMPLTTELVVKPEQEPSKLVIKQKFKFLGIFNANPEEYILQYGNELIPSIFSEKKADNYRPPSLPKGNLDNYAHGELLSA